MLKAILFDLDDTLYEERHYFHSGFSVVARELERRGVGKVEETVRLLEHLFLHESRERVFQKLRVRTPFPEEWIPELVAVFRMHAPAISLPEDAVQVLRSLKKRFRLGCITDGNAQIQNQKLNALAARMYFDAVVLTDELGKAFWKPHPLPFLKCCQILGVTPEEAVFVGDSLERDVAGAANAGMRSVLIRRSGAPRESQGPTHQGGAPCLEVDALRELERLLSRAEDLPNSRLLAQSSAKIHN